MTRVTGTRTQAWSDSRPTASSAPSRVAATMPDGGDLERVDQGAAERLGHAAVRVEQDGPASRVELTVGAQPPQRQADQGSTDEQPPTTVPIRCRRRGARAGHVEEDGRGGHRTIAIRRSITPISQADGSVMSR